MFCALATFTGAAEARDFRVLYQFGGGADGDGSVDQLARDSAGNLYGVTGQNADSFGTVFSVSPGGAKTLLHDFAFLHGTPSNPTGGVVEDAQGNLYGEAVNGGLYVCDDIVAAFGDCGSVYKLDGNGTLTSLHSFQGDVDGGGPGGGLLIDSSGNLYGTTKYGGTGSFCSGGCGTVFKIASDGTKTTLYNFAGQSDGARPTGALIADGQGNLYGTTALGGSGFGTVFKVTPGGSGSVLHAFDGTDGGQPSNGLVMDASGNLYGTTATGGPGGGQYGEVFKLASNGTLSVLHAFNHASGDGVYPQGNLTLGANGNLYGVTTEGGTGCASYGCGTIFRITKDGAYAQLYKINGKTAHNPLGGLVGDGKGNVYGSALGPYGKATQPGILFALEK